MTGCYNYRELNDIAIITGIAIDKEEDEYLVSVMIANSKKPETSDNSSLPTVYESTGKTITLALENIFLQSPKKIYLGHLASVIVGRDVAEDGILNILDFLFREPMSRKTFYLLIADGDKANDVLKIVSPLETFPSQDINNTLNNAYDLQSISSSITYEMFINNLVTDGVEPILATVKIKGDEKEGQNEDSLKEVEPKATIYLSNTAIFKGDKLVDVASKEESEGINLINDGIGRVFIKTKCDNDYIIIDSPRTKLKVDVKDNNKIKIKVNGEAAIKEINCKLNLEDEKVINDLAKDASKELEDTIKKAIDKAQSLKTDIFGFGNLIYKNNYKYFNSVKDEWDEIFSNLDVDIKVDISLKTKGGLEQTIKEKYDEK